MAGNGKVGRPTKFTDEARRKIIWALRLGNYRKTAAEYAGVSERTLCDWLARGEDGNSEYAAFLDEVLEAEQAAEVRALGVIQQAAGRDWKAAAWFLERKFPERYCTRAAVFLAKRLPSEEDLDLAELGEDGLAEELLAAIAGVAKGLPHDKLLAAIEGQAPEQRVIDVGPDERDVR